MATRYPAGLKASGRALWKELTDEFELAQHERLLALQACRCADRLDELAEALEGEPLTVENRHGDQVPHPMLTESRQQAITLTRLVAALRVPDSDDVRPQRRGPRGAYQPRALKAVPDA